MNIPPIWIKSEGDGRTPDGRIIPVEVWGWGNDPAAAQALAAERLQRLLTRLSRGEPFPDKYGYGEVRPLREEILQTFPGDAPDAPAAIVTRNSYGAQVLNVARLLFLDIDFQPQSSGLGQKLLRLFGIGGNAETEEGRLARLRESLDQQSGATFRIYRTAAGFRVLAVDKPFDPTGAEAQALMSATGTDPAYARLCRAQRSFRARLTPKPWRCDYPNPPGQYPNRDRRWQQFNDWLQGYEQISHSYAACRYLETVGRGQADRANAQLIDLHDRLTRCREPLPLA
jgi:hypothetical protein